METPTPPRPDTPARRTTTPEPRFAWGVALALAILKLALHAASTGRFGYGFFVDELYFLAASEHLAWGFVDFPPLLPALTALVRGRWGARSWRSAGAGPRRRRHGGAHLLDRPPPRRRPLGPGAGGPGGGDRADPPGDRQLPLDERPGAPLLDGLRGDPGAPAGFTRPGDRRLWLAFGAVAGLGLLNKHSMAFFGAAVVAALVVTPEGRRAAPLALALARRGARPAALPAQPGLADRARLPALRDAGGIGPTAGTWRSRRWASSASRCSMHHPLALPLWLGGLGWLLFGREGRRWRVLGIAFLGVMAEMLLLERPDLLPGAGLPDALRRRRRGVRAWARAGCGGAGAAPWVPAAYARVAPGTGAILAPLWRCRSCRPRPRGRYSGRSASSSRGSRTIAWGRCRSSSPTASAGPRWRDEVARIYHALPPEDRAARGDLRPELRPGRRDRPLRPGARPAARALRPPGVPRLGPARRRRRGADRDGRRPGDPGALLRRRRVRRPGRAPVLDALPALRRLGLPASRRSTSRRSGRALRRLG